MRILTRSSLLPFALLALAGCGGGGGHHHAETSSAGLVFSSASSDYNGLTTTFTGNAQGNGLNTGYNIILSTDTRFFEISVPSTDIANGTSVDLSAAGATVIYSEGENSDKTWAATSGTLSFSNVSGGKVTATLSGASFSPSTAFGATTGTGTFKLDGKVVSSPVAVEPDLSPKRSS